MLYRMRIYCAVPENLALFHEFFRTHLAPPRQVCPGGRRFAGDTSGAEEKYAPYDHHLG